MQPFRIDAAELGEARARAARRAESSEAARLAEALFAGASLDDEALASIYLSEAVETGALLEAARDRRADPPGIETFSPLYLTNECDAECLMCGMRRFNTELKRETAAPETVEAQLELLFSRGLRGVALLSGEYQLGPRRERMLARTRHALNHALATGFEHILINVGSLEAAEHDELLADVERDAGGRVVPQLTMCTFQETYDRETYGRFMGTNAANPRADYARRLANFDRAADAGLWSVNPGVLLGLNADVGLELLALLAHVAHLRARGLRVYISLPRLRKASGAAHRGGVDDAGLFRLVALLALGAPGARVVISTREAPEIQRALLPVIGVLTPGSPGVAPYTRDGSRFELEASQFEVLDHRPIETILGEVLASGTRVERYEPPARA